MSGLDAYRLDPRRGVVIDPRHDLDADYVHQPAVATARYLWDLKVWRDKMAEAKAKGDYDEMDYLDRQYEMVGMP